MKMNPLGLFRKQKPIGFTIPEIVIVVIVAVVLVAIAAAIYFRLIGKSEDTEAIANLAAIRQAEHAKLAEIGTFVNATDTQDVNRQLPTAEVQEHIFRYKVVNATVEDFVAIAERIKSDISQQKPIEIAMYSDGTTSYRYPTGSGVGGGLGGLGGGIGSGGPTGGGIGGGTGGGIGSGSTGGTTGGGIGGGSGGTGSTGGGSGGGSGGTSTGGGSSGGGFGGVFAQMPMAIGNDGFVNLGWVEATGYVYYYEIYRATTIYGPFELIQTQWPLTSYSDLGLTNEQTYYYKIRAIYAGGTFSDSSVFSTTPSANSIYAIKAATAFQTLAGSISGLEVSQKISLYDVPIGFGSGESALAWYNPYLETITLNLNQFGSSQNVHAALLAHEGTHAWWDHDLTQGQPLRGSNTGDSIDQEYHAFVNGANVWNEVKGTETDYDQDGWASVIARGEAWAKENIRLAYPGLPEY